MKKIELTAEELDILKKDIKGEINGFTANPREVEVITKIVHDAEELLEELDDYDNVGESLEEWYLAQYEKQQKQAAEQAQ